MNRNCPYLCVNGWMYLAVRNAFSASVRAKMQHINKVQIQIQMLITLH